MREWTVHAARPADLAGLRSLSTDTCEPQVLSLAIGWYERSEFSIAHRFRRSRTEVALKMSTAASPTIGAALVAADTTSWPWSIALIAALTARTWLYLFRRGAEADIAERRQWRIRVRAYAPPWTGRGPRPRGHSPRTGSAPLRRGRSCAPAAGRPAAPPPASARHTAVVSPETPAPITTTLAATTASPPSSGTPRPTEPAQTPHRCFGHSPNIPGACGPEGPVGGKPP